MSNEMHELLRDNSPCSPTAAQVEQHTQQSEIVRYLRGLNEWLEWDVQDRRAEIQSMSAHLEQTHNKVIPLLKQIVQAMDLGREGVPPGVVRSPSDDIWDVISSNPSTRVAPTVSSVSTDKVSSSNSSSPSGDSPEFPSLQRPHPSQLSVNVGRPPPLESELDPTVALSLTKTAMPSSDPTEIGNQELVMPEENDAVHTQLRDLMKSFAEHKDEIARKHELAEERWAANQARWEDKHVKDAATHNMLERILANQADMVGKFVAFKDEVLVELALRKSSLSSADHAVTQPQPPSLHPRPQVPSSSSSPIIVGHGQPPPVVQMSCLPSASGKPPSPVLIQPSPLAHEVTSLEPPSRVVPPLCITTRPGIPAPIIIPSTAPPMPLGVGPEDPVQIIRGHYTSSAPSSPSPVPPMPIGIVPSGGPPIPYPLPQQDRISVPICVPTRWSTPYSRSSTPPRSPSPLTPLSQRGSPPLMPVLEWHPTPPMVVPTMPPPMVTAISTVVVPRVSSDSEEWRLPPHPEPITIIERSPSRTHSTSPVRVPFPTAAPPIGPVIRDRSRSPLRNRSPGYPPRPRSPYDPAPRPRSPYVPPRPRSPYVLPRPRSPYDTHRPRSPYDPPRPRSPYSVPYEPRYRGCDDPPPSRRDPYEEEWRRRPRSQSCTRRGGGFDYEHRPPRHSPEPPEFRSRPRRPRSRSRGSQDGGRPQSRDSSREGRRPYRLRSPEEREGGRHGTRYLPGSRSPEYYMGDRHGRPHLPRPRPSEYAEGDRIRRPRSPDSRDSRGSPEGYRTRPTYDAHGRPSTLRPSHPRSEPRVITVDRPPLHPHILGSRPYMPHIPPRVHTEVTEGGEHTLPLSPHLVPPRVPSAEPAEDLDEILMAELEQHVIPIPPSLAPTDVCPRSARPYDRRVQRRAGFMTPPPHSPPRHPRRAPPSPPIPTASPPHTVPAVPRHVIPHMSPTQSVVAVAPSGPSTSDAGLVDAEQERQNAFDELTRALDRTIIDLQDGEVKREENYRANEEERERIFIENERTRESEMEKRLEAMWKRMEDRLAASLPSAIAVPEGSEWTPAPPGELSFEGDSTPDAFELSPGLLGAPVPAHRQADAASRYAADIREANLLEREAALAERERALELKEAAQNQMQEEYKARIRALEDELSAVRRELAEERMARAADEAGQHERKRAEMLAQNDLMRNQVGDLIGLLLHRQDVKAIIRRHDDYSLGDGLKTREGLAVMGPRFAYACLGICLYSVFLVAVWS